MDVRTHANTFVRANVCKRTGQILVNPRFVPGHQQVWDSPTNTGFLENCCDLV